MKFVNAAQQKVHAFTRKIIVGQSVPLHTEGFFARRHLKGGRRAFLPHSCGEKEFVTAQRTCLIHPLKSHAAAGSTCSKDQISPAPFAGSLAPRCTTISAAAARSGK